MTKVRIGIIGDYNREFPIHRATDEALEHAAAALGIAVVGKWLPTDSLVAPQTGTLDRFDALWCAPGSPYRSMEGALAAIRFARESDRPFIGTCAGFQHVVIEYARNVLGITDAHHAEYQPVNSRLLITALNCSLRGKTMSIAIQPGSRTAQAYQEAQAVEQYYCNFGLNPEYEAVLEDGGLRIVGRDHDGEARIVELPDRRFFIATLFVPQVNSTAERPHPLITAYLRAAATAAGDDRGFMAQEAISPESMTASVARSK